jgi:RND superfamily putative drug exporter
VSLPGTCVDPPAARSAIDRGIRAAVRLSVQHPIVVLASWTVLTLLCALLVALRGGSAFGTDIERRDGSDSVRADALLRAYVPEGVAPGRPNEVLVLHSPTLTVDDPAFTAAAQAIAVALQALGPEVIAGARSYFLDGDEALVSADRHTTLVPLVVVDPPRRIERVRAELRAAVAGTPLQAALVGSASIGLDYRELAEGDLRAELRIGVPAAIVVLLIVFGSVVAAALPLAIAAVAVVVALALAVAASALAPVYFLVTNMIVMMGLAVGIDYALFMLVRYRDARRSGDDVATAVQRSGADAGRVVAFSGATVALALLGLLALPTNVYRGLAAGAMAAVVVAVAASVTLLPALLRLLGDRVDALRLPLPRRRLAGDGGRSGSLAARAAAFAVRHPWPCLLAAGALLVALAAPALQMRIGFAGVETLPPSVDSRQAFERLQRDFRVGALADAVVVLDVGHGASTPAQQAAEAALQRLRAALADSPVFVAADALETPSADGRLRVLTLPMTGNPESGAAQAAVKDLRTTLLPRALADTTEAAGAPALHAYVTGAAARYLDFFALTRTWTPGVIAAVLAASFVLLALAFRSVVVPLKAIVLNLLSVGAAYGAMVLVFQHGVGADALGWQQVPVVEAWIPLLLFTILYGLSMDYHVFLLSGIREHWLRGGGNTAAVVRGSAASAGVITGAALIMVAVFAGFAAGDLVMFQQMGFGLAVAVLLDATVVRLWLVPASMTVLGERNWWAPRWLKGAADAAPT